MAPLQTLEKYKADKITMLQRDFGIPMTEEQIEHMNSLVSEMRVDAYARELMRKRFG